MEWHLNDLSVHGQFAGPAAVREALEPILKLRVRRPDLRSRIFCSRTLYLRPATRALNLQQAITGAGDRLFARLALEWFANGGPFWEDERAANPNDYFHFDHSDVTDQGLGEAARRRLDAIEAASLSLTGAGFERTPLLVQHGLPEDPLGQVEVPNHWVAEDLEVHSQRRASSWVEMMDVARSRMPLLVFSEEIQPRLQPSPFHAGIAERILELLAVLQSLADQTQEDSSLTRAGLEILQKYFVGEKASFTDEAQGNKRDFEDEMTFPDPLAEGVKLFCPWHGKVKQGQFRIHFEWKRPMGQRVIKVVYIGPKITKR